MLLLPCPDDIGQVELDLHAGAVFHKGHAVAVADLASHGGQADGELGVTLDAGLVAGSLVNLDVPHPQKQDEEGNHQDARQDQDLAL